MAPTEEPDKQRPSVIKKKNGIKIGIKRKRGRIEKGRKTNEKICFPKMAKMHQDCHREKKSYASASFDETMNSSLSKFIDGVEDSFVLKDDEIPCDTLLLLRTIQQNQQCLFIPLRVNGSFLVPAVLESQLYAKMKGSIEEDSIITQELQDLSSQNKIRRLASGNQKLVAWMETKHYVRAVWDANQSYNNEHTNNNVLLSSVTGERLPSQSSLVVRWFLKNLPAWTNPTISKEALQEKMDFRSSFQLENAIDILIKIQVLLPHKASDLLFLFWLPNWGTVLATIDTGQDKILAHIKRSHYKELSVKTIESCKYKGIGNLSGSFVLHTLQNQNKIEIVSRPSGNFARIPKP